MMDFSSGFSVFTSGARQYRERSSATTYSSKWVQNKQTTEPTSVINMSPWNVVWNELQASEPSHLQGPGVWWDPGVAQRCWRLAEGCELHWTVSACGILSGQVCNAEKRQAVTHNYSLETFFFFQMFFLVSALTFLFWHGTNFKPKCLINFYCVTSSVANSEEKWCVTMSNLPVSVYKSVESKSISPAGGEILNVDLRVPEMNWQNKIKISHLYLYVAHWNLNEML